MLTGPAVPLDPPVRIGIAGTGGVALACAAWLCAQGHAVTLWSPGGRGALPLRNQPLTAHGVVQGVHAVGVADDASALAAQSDVLLVAVPANAHRTVADALAPQLRPGQTVVVSSTASLSALYLFEAAQRHGRAVAVAAFGTTVFTARRDGPASVRVLTRRRQLGVSALPCARAGELAALCTQLFGPGFEPHPNVLASTLGNVNPISHGPLALLNWTRIERAEAWPQYHYLTPRVAAVIERLDAERLLLAQAFGLQLLGIEAHFARSFGTRAQGLAAIADELHALRGGPPGPTDLATRYLAEDMPFGLAFHIALGRLAGIALPATQAVVDAASLAAGCDYAAGNDLLAPLGLRDETVAGLCARVAA